MMRKPTAGEKDLCDEDRRGLDREGHAIMALLPVLVALRSQLIVETGRPDTLGIDTARALQWRLFGTGGGRGARAMQTKFQKTCREIARSTGLEGRAVHAVANNLLSGEISEADAPCTCQ